MNALRPGECEPLKLGVHAALGTLAAVCTVYNSLAFLARREPHLLRNTIVYSALVALETLQCARHAGRRNG